MTNEIRIMLTDEEQAVLEVLTSEQVLEYLAQQEAVDRCEIGGQVRYRTGWHAVGDAEW